MGEPATSSIYWKFSDASLRKDLSNPKNCDMNVVCRYLEDVERGSFKVALMEICAIQSSAKINCCVVMCANGVIYS